MLHIILGAYLILLTVAGFANVGTWSTQKQSGAAVAAAIFVVVDAFFALAVLTNRV